MSWLGCRVTDRRIHPGRQTHRLKHSKSEVSLQHFLASLFSIVRVRLLNKCFILSLVERTMRTILKIELEIGCLISFSAYGKPRMLENFFRCQSSIGVRFNHSTDNVLCIRRRAAPVLPVKFEVSRENQIKEIFLITSRTNKRWISAQQDVHDNSQGPKLHKFAVVSDTWFQLWILLSIYLHL